MRNFFRLVPVILFVYLAWFSALAPALADGPSAAHPLEATIPQELIIPAIDLATPIVTVDQGTITIEGQLYPIWNTAENNVGWHRGSGPPGHPGNTVLAGHSNGGNEIFRRLDEVEIDDDIFVASNSGWHRYRIGDKFIVREQGEPVEVRMENARWILPTTDERLTLITCWPYPLSTHRLIVIAYPLSREAPPTAASRPADPAPPATAEPANLSPDLTFRQIEAEPARPAPLNPVTRLEPRLRAYHLNDLKN
jgi:LPXTG-site transpeptidase (sortase) family protein